MAFALKARDLHRARSGSGYIRAGFCVDTPEDPRSPARFAAPVMTAPLPRRTRLSWIFRCADARIRKPLSSFSALHTIRADSSTRSRELSSSRCIYRRAESASAGQRKMYLSAACQKRAHEQHRRSHTFHHALRYDVFELNARESM